MRNVKPDTICKQADAWLSSYEKNNARGKQAIVFTELGDQWNETEVSTRSNSNKESLTFNLDVRHLRRMKAQGREVEFSLNVAPTNKEYQENMEETNAFRLLLSSILLNDDMVSTFSGTLDRCLEYGYAFGEVNFEQEDEETLCSIPVLRFHKDPSVGFWDKNATTPTKIDGRFCGIKKKISKEEFLGKYPKFKNKCNFLKDQDNEFILYWYRDYDEANYLRLKSGIYKREDLLDDDDRENLATEEDVKNSDLEYDGQKISEALVRPGKVCKIYFTIICNEQVVVDPRVFPTDDLPVPYHPACTVWTEKGEVTLPFTHHMQGAQKLHNYINSQIATISKSVGGDKWLFSDDHIIEADQANEAREINQREGSFRFSGDIATIRREPSAQLPQTMLEMSQLIKQELDEIGGAMMDAKSSDGAVVSRVALDKITHNMGIMNEHIIASHILWVNAIGRLIRQMIPRIFTEERTLLVKKKDGSADAITINQDLGTGMIKNNIKDINNNFHYEIKAGPSSTMQKENTIKYMTALYTVFPQLAPLTADIYFRNIESPDSPELERRVIASFIDPNLIKYSQGEITLEEYMQLKSQSQMQQLQMQTKLSELDPNVQATNNLAGAEHKKAAAQQFDAETKRMKMISDAQNNQEKLRVQLAEILQKGDMQSAQKEIDDIRAMLDASQQVIDLLNIGKENESERPSKTPIY